MGWTAKDIAQRRSAQKKDTKQTTGTKTTTGSGWTESRVAALRGNTGTQKSRTTEAWESRDAGTSTRKQTERHAPTVPKASAQSVAKVNEELADPMLKSSSPTLRSSAGNWLSGTRVLGTVGTTNAKTGSTGTTSAQKSGTGSPVTTDWQEDYEPDWNYVGGTSTPGQRAAEAGTYGWYGQLAQKVRKSLSKNDDPNDAFDKLNQWMEENPKHRKLVDLMQMTGNQLDTDTGIKETDWTTQDTGGSKAKYTDADLLKMGYSQTEINEARQYIQDYEALPLAARAGRRTSNAIGGIVDTAVAFPFQLGETVVQTGKNFQQSAENRKALEQAVQASPREKKLYDALQETDMDYQAKYSTGDLLQMGFTRQEIDQMRARIAGTESHDSVNKDASVGYQFYRRGQDLTGAAQSGLSDDAKVLTGIATSAAENLAVAGLSPALVLPVLSAQGGAEAMGQSMEKDESAGKTLVGGVAKFGAGWAINSVGAKDLAMTMGDDYAKDTLAGQIADTIRKVSTDSAFREAHPAIANAISGGIDNNVQAFVETYADMAIDAALGDEEQAEALFKPETFWTAFESGLSGGASGALGGAVGTGLAAMSGGLDARGAQYDYETRAAQQKTPQPPAAAAPLSGEPMQQAKAEERTEEPSQLRSQPAAELLAAPPKGEPGVEEVTTPVQEQTAVNDDPAVHTPAQNASIAEYKDSVDVKMAEYVDRVRAGETLEPYMVTETSDRMRDAMQQLTGLEKVGDRTLMDANAVKHITNRHAGGDGSADGTMKNSADVARAAYVLSNFDNAYLAKDRADGYKNSKGKSAPIVMFEKKIDGSHIIVEAVLDTKRGNNYIVTEYLAKNGVDKEKVAKALRSSVSAASDPELYARNVAAANSATTESVQAPMDAASDPRDTSETLAAHSSADATVPQRESQVNDGTVEKAGGTVESPAEYADVELHADMANLNADSWTREEQLKTAQQLARRAQMSNQAVQTVADNMPLGIGAEIYAPAAASLYRLGIDGHAASFEEALQKTGRGGVSGGVQQVLALGDAGRTALNIAFLQGQGEAERYRETKAAELGKRPGKAALHEEAGLYYNTDGSVNQSTKADDAFIELSAKASGVAAQRVASGLAKNAKGLLQSAAGRVFYSGEADTATVMHETLHELNSWDNKGGQELIDQFAKYLVQQNGMDNVQQLVQGYLDRYEKAGQKLTYNQAMEEITADAMRTVFGTEESFRTYLRQQAAEAKMNAQAQGRCDRVMQKIEMLLQKVLTDIKTLLGKEPTNAAAKAAKTLTEQQLKDLQTIYFDHQMEAGANYRAALEANGGMEKAAAADATAAEGARYSIDPEYASDIDQWDKDGRPDDETFILGRTGDTLQQLGARENDIYMKADKINTILHEHPEMTLEEIKRIPEVLDDPAMILTSQNKGRTKQNTRLVMFGDVKAQDGRPMLCVLDLRPVEDHIVINDMQKVTSAYTKDVNPVEFVRKSTVLYVDENQKRTTELLRTLGFKTPSERQLSGSMGSITYQGTRVKFEGVNFTELETNAEEKNRYQLDVDSEDVEAAKNQSVGDGGEQSQTAARVMELAGQAKVSEEHLALIARKVTKQAASRADTKTLTSRLAALQDYLTGGDVDWAQAHGFMLDMAQQIMEGSTKKNDALWKAYPDLHQMGMSLQKGSKDYNEVLYRYGSWGEARKELAKHGINLTLTKNGAESRWDADFPELQKLGAGLLPEETPSSAADALEAMAAAHDAIKPTMESAYDTDWDSAKQEMAMELWNEYLGLPGVANSRNAALRQQFAERTKEMNEKAKEHSLELQIKANLKAAQGALNDIQTIRGDLAEKLGKEMVRHQEQLEKLRDSRDKDNTRRAIRNATNQLNHIFEHPTENRYVPDYLVDKVSGVARLANEAIGNRTAAERLAKRANEDIKDYHYRPIDRWSDAKDLLTNLATAIETEKESATRASVEWENSGLAKAIQEWSEDVEGNRNQKIKMLQGQIEEAERYLTKPNADERAYLNRLHNQLNAVQNGGMATLSGEELRGLRDIIDQTLYIIRNENAMLGAMEDVAVDEFAEQSKEELEKAKGISRKEGLFGKVSRGMASYRMNTMNIERTFERLGGYEHGGRMENLGKMLNDGQRKKTKILIEGTNQFENVTGPAHEKELYHFTHDLVDIGLVDDEGRTRKITHDQLAELWLQLQNQKGMHHILHGGITLENMEARMKGDTKLAKRDSATVRVGELAVTDSEGNKLDAYQISQQENVIHRNLLDEIEKNLTDYDRQWIEDYKKLNEKQSGYINETSMLLSGVRKAGTKNYIHINVDQNTNAEQNKGIRYDNSAGSQGFLKERVNSSKPIVLMGLVNQVTTSIENVAQYAGMAVPLRNAEKVLNSMQGGKTLYWQLEKTWGSEGRDYVNKALADLCDVKDSREVGDGAFARLRSMGAQAVLAANVNVTLLQAASLPTAAAELGWWSTGAAAGQFAKNLGDPRNLLRFFDGDVETSLTKIEARMREHGDELLQYRLRGTGTAELGSAGAQKDFLGRAHDAARNSSNALVSGAAHAADKLVSLWTSGITKMDEITVAAIWEGSENYVKNHPEEFGEGAEVADSPAYWAAVNEKFQRVVERTQPNYTPMQRTGYQRTKNEMTKFLMMFSTQRQQNAQIWTASVEDLAAQFERYKGQNTDEAKQARKTAVDRFVNASTSQVMQTALIAVLGIGVKFGLHRWDDLQDENGDMTWKSLLNTFCYDFFKSFIGNWTGGSEALTAAEMVLSGGTKSYDTISMTGISAINDLAEYMGRVWALNAKDTSEMTEAELETHKQKSAEAVADLLGQAAMLRGVPYTNLKKQVQAVTGWMDTFANWNKEGGNFNSLPSSATGQYNRLYNAYASGDKAEAQAAMEKLIEMGKEDEAYKQLKSRLVKYDANVEAAAKAQNAGNDAERAELTRQIVRDVYTVLGIRTGVDADAAKRTAVINMVTGDKEDGTGSQGAINQKAEMLLKGDNAKVTDDLVEALDGGRASDVQQEIDRLLTAGKDVSSVKSAITTACKPEYVAGSDYDRSQMDEMLLGLVDADGKALYTQKTLDGWVTAAEKEAEKEPEKEPEKDPLEGLR